MERLQSERNSLANLTVDEISSLELSAVEKRYNRLNTLHQMSNIAQSVGHLNSRFACNIRDVVLSLFPQSVKGSLFDFLIQETSK